MYCSTAIIMFSSKYQWLIRYLYFHELQFIYCLQISENWSTTLETSPTYFNVNWVWLDWNSHFPGHPHMKLSHNFIAFVVAYTEKPTGSRNNTLPSKYFGLEIKYCKGIFLNTYFQPLMLNSFFKWDIKLIKKSTTPYWVLQDVFQILKMNNCKNIFKITMQVLFYSIIPYQNQISLSQYLFIILKYLCCDDSVIGGIGEVDLQSPPAAPQNRFVHDDCPYLLLDCRDADAYNQCHIISGTSSCGAGLTWCCAKSIYDRAGLPLVREKSGKFKIREKSGNFRICQGNLEFCWKSGKFKKSQGNLRKFIFHKRYRWSISISKNFHLAPLALASYFSTRFILNLQFFTKICYLKRIQTCT